jgi:hypothetical protein
MEKPSNPLSGLSTGSQLNPAVKLSESELMQQQLEELLDRIPKQLRFLACPSATQEDWANFIGLITLVAEQIDLSNPVGLVYVRDFVGAVVETISLARRRDQIIYIEQQSILRAQIEKGLVLERRPDHEIDLGAALMTKECFEGHLSWRELTDRFPNVFRRHQLEAAAFQARLLDISRIELLIKNCEQRRDRALKNLAAFRKPEAERLRELAHSLEKSDVKPPVDSEIVVPAKS